MSAQLPLIIRDVGVVEVLIGVVGAAEAEAEDADVTYI
jgi:hypothetical protein